MSMQDPIADMLTRIRNGQKAAKYSVEFRYSKVKHAVALVLKEEGYVLDVEEIEEDNKPCIKVVLKYFNENPVIRLIKRISRPGLRIYKGADQLPRVLEGLGIAIISTPKGVMSDKKARKRGIGGEILCYVE